VQAFAADCGLPAECLKNKLWGILAH